MKSVCIIWPAYNVGQSSLTWSKYLCPLQQIMAVQDYELYLIHHDYFGLLWLQYDSLCILGNLAFQKSATLPVLLHIRWSFLIGLQPNKPNMVVVSHLLVIWSVSCYSLYYFYPTMESSQRCLIGAFFKKFYGRKQPNTLFPPPSPLLFNLYCFCI